MLEDPELIILQPSVEDKKNTFPKNKTVCMYLYSSNESIREEYTSLFYNIMQIYTGELIIIIYTVYISSTHLQ